MHSLEAAEGHLARVENALKALHSRFAASSQPADRYYMLVTSETLTRVKKARFELSHLSTLEIPAQW